MSDLLPTNRSLGGLILCGGKSTRMGQSKAHLPFGDQTMLSRMVDHLESICQTLVIVAAEEQPLPPLPDFPEGKLEIARDRRPGRGPLEGLITGLAKLRSLHPEITHVYATSCDVPLLRRQWPLALLERIGDSQVAVPYDDQFHHPLAAVYRTDVLPALEQLSDHDELRPRRLFDVVRTVRVHVNELRSIDPELDTLKNLNTPDDYLAALRRQGLPLSEEIRQELGLPSRT